ncbi:hypothetical protein AB3S75_031930 [Citrus x aurantiifolia]
MTEYGSGLSFRAGRGSYKTKLVGFLATRTRLESGQLLFMGPITVHHVDRRPAVNITPGKKKFLMVTALMCTWRYHGILLY